MPSLPQRHRNAMKPIPLLFPSDHLAFTCDMGRIPASVGRLDLFLLRLHSLLSLTCIFISIRISHLLITPAAFVCTIVFLRNVAITPTLKILIRALRILVRGPTVNSRCHDFVFRGIDVSVVERSLDQR